jgi:hypothetical protein
MWMQVHLQCQDSAYVSFAFRVADGCPMFNSAKTAGRIVELNLKFSLESDRVIEANH